MLRFLADEGFNKDIVDGVLRVRPDVDILRTQDCLPVGAHDQVVLQKAAQEDRIVLSHDESTMIDYAYKRVKEELTMPGLILVKQTAGIRHVIEDILLIAACSREDEWEGQVLYLPFPK